MAITAFLSHSPGTCSSFQHLLSNWSELQLLYQGSWGPPLLGAGFLYRILSPTDWTSCAPSYIIIWRPLFSLRVSQFHTQFNPSTVKVISWYSSTGCTCYLHRCISYFDSLSGVNMLHHVHYHYTMSTSWRNHIIVSKLFVLRMVTWKYYCLLWIIIIGWPGREGLILEDLKLLLTPGN